MCDDFDFEVMGKFVVSLPISSRDTEFEEIQDRIRNHDAIDLFQLAADSNETTRARWVAMCGLPATERQRLSDTLVVRPSDNTMWSAIESCPPTNSDAAILALPGHLDSEEPRHRRVAIQALSHMGDTWAISEVDAMLAGDNPNDHLFAIHCIAQRDSELKSTGAKSQGAEIYGCQPTVSSPQTAQPPPNQWVARGGVSG